MGFLNKHGWLFLLMSDKQEFKDTVIQNEGLWQRLNLAFMYMPLIVVSIKKLTEK